ncbi:spinster family MFS transporter [Nitrospirillum viridazoti]|uniref:MFS transporter n=1 Tax=Nitrospirillum viridazoti CBAmc TaxID=1441467 RepID=A0A248K190_9PROT|nr:MFS transporter [Nitrospirillum amazonense]ASG24536.1 MFS transporter [Nitrospirillum amazonense CBAmc]TWB37111.1 putative MFS family arabinose efflux permease [Nitrospirillum amazonense]
MTIVSPAPKPVSTSPRGTAPPPDARAWYVLAALCFVYVLNFLDRQLLSILAKPIQDDLGVSDGQLGLISGLYFALFYCFISIPVAWLADRTNRVRVLSIACALWSAATVACGLSATYPQLVLARMTVGVGEAGGVPPSYAIITDYFPPGRRGAALGLFNLGPPLGQALGVAFGASIAAAYSWRQAFLVLGMFGVAAALIVWLTIREPKRGRLDAPPVGATPAQPAEAPAQAKAGFIETVAMFFRRPALLLMALACGATQFVTYAVMNFTVLFLMREKGMSLQQVAVYYALLIGIGISIGMYASGRLVDRFSGRSKQAYALVPALGLAGAVPFFVGFVWAPGWQLALLLLIGPTILNYFFLSPAVTLVQEEVRPSQRVLSGALLLLVMNLIGLGFGPTYLGAASDHFRTAHPGNSLQLAFYTLVPFYFLAITLFLALARVLEGEANRTGDH